MTWRNVFTCRKPHIDTAHHKLHWTTTAFEYDVFTCEVISEYAVVAENFRLTEFRPDSR